MFYLPCGSHIALNRGPPRRRKKKDGSRPARRHYRDLMGSARGITTTGRRRTGWVWSAVTRPADPPLPPGVRNLRSDGSDPPSSHSSSIRWCVPSRHPKAVPAYGGDPGDHFARTLSGTGTDETASACSSRAHPLGWPKFDQVAHAVIA